MYASVICEENRAQKAAFLCWGRQLHAGKASSNKTADLNPPHPPGMIPVYCDSLTVKGKSPVSLVIIRFRNVLYERNRK